MHTSFQGKIRAFSLADRLGKRRKRLEQRFRLLALGTRHLADSAAPRGVPSGTGNRFVSDEEVPKRARESDRPIASRFPFFGELRDEGTEASDVCGTTRGAAPWVGSPKTAHRSGSASSASSKRREERINSTTRSSGAARPPPTGGPLRLPQHHHGNITRPFRRPRQHPTRRARDRPPPIPRARASRLRPHSGPRRPTPSFPTVGTTAWR